MSAEPLTSLRGAEGAPGLSFDVDRAGAFVDACIKAHVTYGLGRKIPTLNAVPGRDFRQVDCSGFVRELVRLSTMPPVTFPDGSVNQHDWVRGHGFEPTTIESGGLGDGIVRIAFLRPQDSPESIGHVVLISDGRTLESHGGVGPDRRPWTGQSWQAKAHVYVFARSVAQAAATTASLASTFTVRHGRRYRATVVLSGFETFAGNDVVAGKLTQVGFVDVSVTGNGGTRQAEATWNGPDTTATIDPHLTGIVEVTPASPTAVTRVGAVANISSSVFSTESLPAHHEGLLVVRMRSGAPAIGAAASFATSPPDGAPGLGALSFYERAGMIRRVVPLHAKPTPPTDRVAAVAALAFAPLGQDSDAMAGINFIELQPGQSSAELHAALAGDPNVAAVSRVPARYLLARRPRATADQAATAAAVPPDAALMWNLERIRWQEARGQAGFVEAGATSVAVLDTGADVQHPQLHVDEYHWQQIDIHAVVSDKDIIGHGTHVSGTIAATIGKAPVKGICRPKLSVWKIFSDEPLYQTGTNSFVYTVNPIMYLRALTACLDAGLDVINLSIGGPGAPDPIEQGVLDQLTAAGVTICAAMGNERQYGSPVSYPAAVNGAIAVGATGLDDRVALFSNSGNHIALAAPGKSIWSTLPTYGGQTGFGAAFGSDGRPLQGKAMTRETNYDAWDGTSMATPHVAGAAALYIAKRKAADGTRPSPADVKQALMASADKIEAMNGAPFTVDYGAGRLNLLQLLR